MRILVWMVRILLVDDDAGFRDRVGNLVREEMPEAILAEAATFAEARTRLADGWACVLLDIRLPDGNGFDLLRDLQNAWPSTPAVMLSGMPAEPFAMEARRLGAAAYVEKTSTADRLIATLYQVLAK